MKLSRTYGTLLALCLIDASLSARILGLFFQHGRSHYNMPERLLLELAKRGHTVDSVSHFPQKNKVNGFNDISIAGTYPPANFQFDMLEQLATSTLNCEYLMWRTGETLFETIVGHERFASVRNLTVNRYDLIITQIVASETRLALAKLFNYPPVVAFTSSVSLPWSNDPFGTPDNPSYIPNYFTSFSNPMTFGERVWNTIMYAVTKIWYNYATGTYSDRLSKKFLGSDTPHINEFINNVSLVLVNSHFSMNEPRPTPPNFIEVGGLHIKDVEPLNERLERIVNGSTGVVLVSFGSQIVSETFPIEKLRVLSRAFAKLPFAVVWKADREKFPRNLTFSDNVHFERWVPQLDLLCHAKTKLFITHGGLHGAQEAVYCAVPSIGIPFFSDQYLNTRTFARKRIAEQVLFDEITQDSMDGALSRVLYDDEYQKRMQQYSDLFRDRPIKPLNLAVYWMEYVIKNKGAGHLRPYSTQLAWYQLLLFDVLGVIAGVLFVISCVLYLLTRRIFTYVRERLSSMEEKKKV